MMQSHRHQSLRNTPGLSKRAWSYADFVRANPAGARTVESLLRYAGFFAPVSAIGYNYSENTGECYQYVLVRLVLCGILHHLSATVDTLVSFRVRHEHAVWNRFFKSEKRWSQLELIVF